MSKEEKQENNLDIQANMELYRKLGTPGEQHKLLASLTGSWKVRVKSWTESDKPPMESLGTCEQKMVLGGRFLQQDFSGDMLGTKFNGIGITGYDNYAKKYVSTWIDSMGTGILFFEGIDSTSNKTIIQECHHHDPARGAITWRSVTTIIDDSTWMFEMYSTYDNGKEAKGMEIIYER